MPKFRLNTLVPGNYCFYCDTNKIRLDAYLKQAEFPIVSDAIIRGVMVGTIMDLEEVIDKTKIKSGLSPIATDFEQVKKEQSAPPVQQPSQPLPFDDANHDDEAEIIPLAAMMDEPVEVVEEKPKRKRTTKKTKDAE